MDHFFFFFFINRLYRTNSDPVTSKSMGNPIERENINTRIERTRNDDERFVENDFTGLEFSRQSNSEVIKPLTEIRKPSFLDWVLHRRHRDTVCFFRKKKKNILFSNDGLAYGMPTRIKRHITSHILAMRIYVLLLFVMRCLC